MCTDFDTFVQSVTIIPLSDQTMAATLHLEKNMQISLQEYLTKETFVWLVRPIWNFIG